MKAPDPRLPPPTAEALAHSAQVAGRVRQELDATGGWIDFARYMELALYAPGLGYYSGGATKLGGAGDFITAPELTPLYAATLARQVAEILAHAPGDVLELGAGSGRMAVDLLLALDEIGRLPERYRILEVSAELRARQLQAVGALPAPLRARIEWLDALPDAISGAVIGNEVLDALPVHLLVWDVGEVHERGVVARAAGFAFADRPLAAGALLERARKIAPPAPYVSEVSLAVPALIAALGARLARGALLFVDYGFGSAEYYHPQRARGTLMCHYRHRAHDDPFFLPGLQDITAHVDFSAVARAGEAAGLSLLGYTSQAHFLVNLGITDLLAHAPAEDAARYLPLAAQAHTLLNPAEMGELFKVIALARDLPAGLTGFARGDRTRLL